MYLIDKKTDRRRTHRQTNTRTGERADWGRDVTCTRLNRFVTWPPTSDSWIRIQKHAHLAGNYGYFTSLPATPPLIKRFNIFSLFLTFFPVGQRFDTSTARGTYLASGTPLSFYGWHLLTGQVNCLPCLAFAAE